MNGTKSRFLSLAILFLVTSGCGYWFYWYNQVPEKVEWSGREISLSFLPTKFEVPSSSWIDTLFYLLIGVAHKDSSYEAESDVRIENVRIYVGGNGEARGLTKYKETKHIVDNFDPDVTHFVYSFGPFRVPHPLPDSLLAIFDVVVLDSANVTVVNRQEMKVQGNLRKSRQSHLVDFFKGY